MAKKKLLGIEIGNNRMKIAFCSNYDLEKIMSFQLPDNLVRDDEIVSWEAMADFIKETIKENKITYKEVAVVLPEKSAYIKRITMPAMTVDQLKVNLPFEFHDYITEDKEKYFYDYALLEMRNDSAGNPSEMELMAVASLKETVNQYKTMFRRAGLRLILIAPEFAAFRNIIKDYEFVHNLNSDRDYAVLDVGHRALRLHFFTKGEYEITRSMEPGCESITRLIADELDIDGHIAQITKETNKDDILHSQGCMDMYNQMAVEIMRVLNFYNFNHPENNLEALYYCGGGSLIKPLLEAVESMIDIKLTSIENLITDKTGKGADLLMSPQALGITWE